ncbi:unnamed protein product [Amoebophrya sp. A25]|nr:unnamed protein product [Amoebophrya sp. A25]|eukprot:GSA25T00013750001.1
MSYTRTSMSTSSQKGRGLDNYPRRDHHLHMHGHNLNQHLEDHPHDRDEVDSYDLDEEPQSARQVRYRHSAQQLCSRAGVSGVDEGQGSSSSTELPTLKLCADWQLLVVLQYALTRECRFEGSGAPFSCSGKKVHGVKALRVNNQNRRSSTTSGPFSPGNLPHERKPNSHDRASAGDLRLHEVEEDNDVFHIHAASSEVEPRPVVSYPDLVQDKALGENEQEPIEALFTQILSPQQLWEMLSDPFTESISYASDDFRIHKETRLVVWDDSSAVENVERTSSENRDEVRGISALTPLHAFSVFPGAGPAYAHVALAVEEKETQIFQ